MVDVAQDPERRVGQGADQPVSWPVEVPVPDHHEHRAGDGGERGRVERAGRAADAGSQGGRVVFAVVGEVGEGLGSV